MRARSGKVNLNPDKTEVLCQICGEWKNLNTETLWLVRDDEVVEIRCIKCDVLLGYDFDIPDF